MVACFICMLKTDFYGAAKYNILSIPLFFGVVVYCFLCFADVIFKKDYIFILEKYMSKKYMYPIYGIIIVVSYAINF